MALNNIQFELWKNCTNGCDFCFNKGLPCSTKEDKIRILKEVQYRLERLNYDYYDKIGFIGGELFGNQLEEEEVFKEFYKLFELCIKLLQNKKINQINFTSNLLAKDNSKMYQILDLIKIANLLNKFELCTSWDSQYRFKLGNLSIWEKNITYIKETYPDLQTHIEILPTQHFCEECLNGNFDYVKFKKKYKSAIDYSDLNSGFYYKDKFEMEKEVPGFFPKRATFLKWVRAGLKENWFKIEDICNYSIFFNELYMLDKTNHFIQYIRHGHDEQLPYGKIAQSDYIDSDVLMYIDLKNVEKYHAE
ncbi:MAG: hypothetical protein IJ880_11475 [Bacilli bacterium]|nr:hypothetical protein [Bacilli bacterium]